MEVITTAFSQIITWVGSFVTALFTSSGALYALLPYFVISIGVSILLVCVKIARKLIYGA